MNTAFSLVLCMALTGVSAVAQTQLNPLPLWPKSAPGALGTTTNDIPAITAYLPDPAKATGAAFVICPGGGYAHLASHEGRDYALWLNQYGIAGIVLQYRLATAGYHHPSMLEDATRAMRLTHFNATEWKIDPKRIGIMGSSAGGHLASTLLTHFDAGQSDSADPIERESSRPSLGILCYPVITMGSGTHGGSKVNLLGKNPSLELIEDLSSEKQVTTNTPPCFIFSTADDTVVPVENSLLFAEALRRNKVPFDLHIFQHGAHGMGLGAKLNDPAHFHPWTADLIFWLKLQGYVR